MPTLVSIVISAYNEAESLPRLFRQLNAQLERLTQYRFEVLLVNDGSQDQTAQVAQRLISKHKHWRLINLAGNFGHEAAMLAGIDQAQGKAIICMDADLQHPPSKLPAMLKAWQQGYQVVMMRKVADQNRLVKRMFAFVFYRVMNLLSDQRFHPDATDFFLISRAVAQQLKSNYRERSRFLRGLVQIMGFPHTSLTFQAPARQAGKSKYPLHKLLILSLIALTSFSQRPLRLGIVMGAVMSGFSLVLALYSVWKKLAGEVVPGYTTIVVFVSLMFAIQFLILGIFGEYLRVIFEEVKRRPIYILDQQDED